jgi:hypothetical protein
MRRFLALAALSLAVSVALTAVAFLVTRSGRLHMPGAELADESTMEVPE